MYVYYFSNGITSFNCIDSRASMGKNKNTVLVDFKGKSFLGLVSCHKFISGVQNVIQRSTQVGWIDHEILETECKRVSGGLRCCLYSYVKKGTLE